MSLEDTISRVCKLDERGYSVGVWIVDYPGDELIKVYQKCFQGVGIDCRLKEYLDGNNYGTYLYRGKQGSKNVLCKPSEMLVAPNGDLHRCHGDLYNNRMPCGSLVDKEIKLINDFTFCKKVACNSCDIKIKTNRFQEYGHCAVQIKEINE